MIVIKFCQVVSRSGGFVLSAWLSGHGRVVCSLRCVEEEDCGLVFRRFWRVDAFDGYYCSGRYTYWGGVEYFA